MSFEEIVDGRTEDGQRSITIVHFVLRRANYKNMLKCNMQFLIIYNHNVVKTTSGREKLAFLNENICCDPSLELS